jgi:hypothetical protein
MNLKAVERKPGRPRAIPEALIPKVLSLYHEGLGYRAVARELRREGISVDCGAPFGGSSKLMPN